MFRASTLLIALASTLAVTPGKDLSELESLVNTEIKRNNVPGCAVAIVLDQEIVFAKGFGVANLEISNAVTTDTLFRIGSTTKMFTAATLVSLAEENKVKLEAPIGECVKGLHSKLARLTSHQLLTHTAGLADETKMEGLHDEAALGEALRARDDDLCFTEPGDIWSYSNPGYWLAGLVIEQASGEHYADAVHERVLAPLGMKRSTFRPTEAMTWPLAIGHGPEGRAPATVIRPLGDNAAGWPAGQLFTTANEYARFCIAFMNGGKLESKQVLSPLIIEKLSEQHVPIPGSKRFYGYGLSIEDKGGLRWLSHGGSRTGYGSRVEMCPEKKFGMIILCNKTGNSLPGVAQKAAQLIIGVSPPTREPRHNPLATDAGELEHYAGIYTNGKTRTRLFVRDGKLHGPAGGVLERIGENRFLRTEGAGTQTELIFVPGTNGAIKYLMREGRALRKD